MSLAWDVASFHRKGPKLNPASPSPDDSRPELTLLMQNVPDAERTKAAAFLKVGSARLECEWALVSSGDVDVLMHGADEPSTVPGLLDEPVATLHLADTSEHRPFKRNGLARPLQFEDFMNALAAAEGAIMAPPVVKKGTVTSRVSIAVAPALAAPVAFAGPIAMAAPAEASFTLDPRALYRLRRWPPSRLLLGHRYHSRLAGFMSVRHVGIDELARLSNVSVEDCKCFLTALGTESLLDIKPMPASVPVAQAPSVSTLRPVPMPQPETSLFGKLRRRLGLDAFKK